MTDAGITSRGRVVGLFPHPDDEAYAAGGTLTLLAQNGFDIRVVCATRGERGGRRDGVPISPPELAALRGRELLASCGEMGIQKVGFLDFLDGAVHEQLHESGVQRVLEELDLQSVQAVITLGWDGVYGHRDHIATTKLLHGALELMEPGTRPLILHCAFPRGLFAGIHRSLSKMPPPGVLADLGEEELGNNPEDVSLRVDISSVRAQKLAAIAAHRSQLLDGDPMKFFGGKIIPRLLDEERFVCAAGALDRLPEFGLPLAEP